MTYRPTKVNEGRKIVTDDDVLHAVAEHPGSTYRELARNLDVCVSTIRRRMDILISQGKVEVVKGNDSAHTRMAYCDLSDMKAGTAADEAMLSVRAFFRKASPYARNAFVVATYTESTGTVKIIQHNGLYTLNVLCKGESHCKTLGFELCVDGVRRLYGGVPLQMMGLNKRKAPEGTVIYSKDMSIVTEVSG